MNEKTKEFREKIHSLMAEYNVMLNNDGISFEPYYVFRGPDIELDVVDI